MNTKPVRKNGWMVVAMLASLSACNTPDPELVDTTLPDRIAFTASRQYPEGIAYEPSLNKFLVSSLTQGKIGAVNRTGAYTDLIATDTQLIAAVGMKMRNGLLYVCNGDLGVSDKSTTTSAMKTAGLFVYDLSTNQNVRRVNLASLLPSVNHYANDIAFDSQGNAFVTDSFAPVIYRIPADANQAATILVRSDSLFSGQNFNLNGIVYLPDNFLIVGKANEGKLFKVDLANNNLITPVTGVNLPGCDGMLFYNNELYVVHERTKMSRVTSSDGWKSAAIQKTDVSGYEDATTNTEANGAIYALNARIGEASAAATAKNPSSLTANAYSIKKYQP